MAWRRRKFLRLRPNKLHTFKVRAWDRNSESDFSDAITLKTSDRPGIGWYDDNLIAKPIWWNKQIKVTWNPIPFTFRKWMDEYLLFRYEVGPSDTPPTPSEWNAIIAQSKLDLENSAYYIHSTKKFRLYFDDDIVADSNFLDTADDAYDYYYWVIALDDTGATSTPGVSPPKLGHLGPDYASWGPPDDPQWRVAEFETIVHEVNKWWCDVKVVWRQKGGAEHYLIRHRLNGRTLWSLPTKIFHDDTLQSNPNSGEYRYTILRNFLCNRAYDFEIRAVNITGILKSAWVETTYTTEKDESPPDEITGVAARRTWYSGTALVQKGEFVKLTWNMPANPIINQQLDHYEIFRLKGTESEADTYTAQINADPNNTSVTPFTETAKFLGTQLIDDNVEGIVSTGTGYQFDFQWFCEGADDTARRTASTLSGDVVGSITGSAAVSNTQAYEGSWSLYHPSGINNYIAFASTNGFFDPDEGYLEFYYWANNIATVGHILAFRYSFSNQIYIYIGNPNEIWMDRYDDWWSPLSCNTDSSELVGLSQTWVKVEARWSVSEGDMSIRVNGGTWHSASAGAPRVMSGFPTLLYVGSRVGGRYDDSYLDNLKVSPAYQPPALDSYYHYWLRGADVYGKKSLVTGPSDSPNASYDQVSFGPPDQPENLGYDTNVTSVVLAKKWFAVSLHWDPEDEATHYQVRIRIKPPGVKLNGQPKDYGPWMTSLFLEESKHIVTDTGDDEYGKAKYVYPFPVAYNHTIQAKVRALNRAGASNDWDDITALEFVVEKDTEGPGNILESTFVGDCMGVKPLFGSEFWLGVNLKWQPRPKHEGVVYYEIDVKHPTLDRWTNVWHGSGITALDSYRFHWVRAHALILSVALPTENRTTASNTFRIGAYDDDETRCEIFTETTVNFEQWWVF